MELLKKVRIPDLQVALTPRLLQESSSSFNTPRRNLSSKTHTRGLGFAKTSQRRWDKMSLNVA